MKSVTSAYKTAVKGYGRQFENEVVVSDGTNTETYTNAEITINETFSEDDSLSMGAYFSSEAKIKLYEPTGSVAYKNCSYTINSKLLVNGEYESVAMGVYYPSEVKKNDGSIEITAYDKMSRLQDDYEPSSTTPTTDTALLSDICTQKGITLASGTSALGTTISVVSGTCAEQLGWLAGLQGKNAVFNEEGKLEFRWYALQSETLSRADQVENGCSLDEGSFTISSLTSGTSENVITCGTGKGLSFTNPYMTSTLLTTIWNALGNKTFYTGSVENFGFPMYEVGDIVNVVDKDNTSKLFYLSNNSWTLQGGCHCTSESIGNPDAEIEFDSTTPQAIGSVASSLQEAQRKFSNIINTESGVYSITEEDGVTTGWTIVDNPTNPQNVVVATNGGIGIGTNGLDGNYTTAITGEGISASAITVGKVKANQLDITGTASFYENSDTDAYGILLMPESGNKYSTTTGYAEVKYTYTYLISGSYTSYGFTTTIGGSTEDVTAEIVGSNFVWQPFDNGYLYITGGDSTSKVQVVAGDAIVGGYKPYNSTTHEYDDFVTLFDINVNGDANFSNTKVSGDLQVYDALNDESCYISGTCAMPSKMIVDDYSVSGVTWYYRAMGDNTAIAECRASLGSKTYTSSYGNAWYTSFSVNIPSYFFPTSIINAQVTPYVSGNGLYSAFITSMSNTDISGRIISFKSESTAKLTYVNISVLGYTF